jgi:hypothetical protein
MKSPAARLAGILFLIPVVLIAYRIIWLGYPLFPTVPGTTWRVSMKARVQAGEGWFQVEVGLPRNVPQQAISVEQIASGSLGFDFVRDRDNRLGIWSGLVEDGEESIGYEATVLVRPRRANKDETPVLGEYPLNTYPEERELAKRLVAQWTELPLPARLNAIIGTLDGNWGGRRPAQADLEAWSIIQSKQGVQTALLMLLRAGNIIARSVEGLPLGDSVRRETLRWIEIWTGGKWERLRLSKGEFYRQPALLLPLAKGQPAVIVSAGKLLESRWTISRQVISDWLIHFDRIRRSGSWLDRWSLFHLPPEFQETFRILLLVPISALMISILRNVVGFPTFGIFMPVLMALAFRSTGLAGGLGAFGFVIGVGYFFRRIVDKLRLLLVPRLSVLLTLVIFCITVVAVAGNLLGVREFMAVGLLPIVILTMVIERFFIITEEAGIREALRTAAGSAAVAAITYGIIRWEPLQLTFFVYPELMFAVAAFQVLLGRYTGFRLSEFSRFRAFRGA